MKADTFHREIFRMVATPETIKIKDVPREDLVGKFLHVIPEPGCDQWLKEKITRVTEKRVYTSESSYSIENGFEIRGKGHAKVIAK